MTQEPRQQYRPKQNSNSTIIFNLLVFWCSVDSIWKRFIRPWISYKLQSFFPSEDQEPLPFPSIEECYGYGLALL